jgi:hypothetical protein
MVSCSFASLLKLDDNGKFHFRAVLVDTVQGKPLLATIPDTFFLYSVAKELELTTSSSPGRIFEDCQDELLDMGFEVTSSDVSDNHLCFAGDFEKEDVTLSLCRDITLKGTLYITVEVGLCHRELHITFFNTHDFEDFPGTILPFEDFCKISFVDEKS